MKILFGGSTVVLLIFLASLEGGLSSCVKDKTIYDTVTVIKNDTTTIVQKDTVIIKDTVLTTEIFTAHPWKIQEEKGVLGGDTIYYLRGGSPSFNTESFDNEFATFYADKTGFIMDNNGASHRISAWDFANEQHSKIVFTMYNDLTTFSTYTWDNIRYKNKNLYLDQYFTDNLTGKNAHSQQIRIPK